MCSNWRTDAASIRRETPNVFSDMALIAEPLPAGTAFCHGDLFTMGPREAALACRLLKAKRSFRCIFGTFPPLAGRPGDLAKLVDAEVWALQPASREVVGRTTASRTSRCLPAGACSLLH